MLNLNRGILVKDFIKKYKFILIFAVVAILAAFFPIGGRSLVFHFFEPHSLADLSKISPYGLVSNLMSMVLCRMPIMRILVYGALSTSLFVLMKNVVDNKNSSLLFLAGFFFLLMDKSIFASSFVDFTGFSSYFVGSIFLIILLNVLVKNSLARIKRSSLFVLGLVGTSIVPAYSFVFFFVTLFYLFFESRDENEKEMGSFLLMGEVLGIVHLALSQKLSYSGFSFTLMQRFIPLVSDSNFIVVLILSSMVLIGSMKIFSYGRRGKIILAMLGIISFLFSSLLGESVIIKYITYVFFMAGTIYLLFNIRTSQQFRRRITYYFLFKIVTILFLCLFGNVEYGSLVFLSFIDILMILEFYDGVLPKNFMSHAWMLLFVILTSANIYIYSKTAKKFDEMTIYIKNKLECARDNYSIPNKYYTEYLSNYIPTTREELENYVRYYGIVVLGDIENIDLHFYK